MLGAHAGRDRRSHPMKLSVIAVLAGVAVAVVGPGAAAARTSAAQATTVKIKATDFKFTLSTKTVKHGRITFVINNAGSTAHDFAIAGRRSRTIDPGKSTRLTVLLKRGRYPYKCTVDSHSELGMKGVLRVT
jgi:uncharacterized cupredoxin-like copper-binding protein